MHTVERRLSWGELLEEATRRPKWTCELSSEERGSFCDSFAGTPDYAAAMRLFREGWQEGRDRIVNGLMAVTPPTIRHETRRLDVAGAYPIVPLAITGDPVCMVDMGEEIAPRPVVRLVVSTNGNMNINRTTFINRGIAICSVIDAMENAGQRVELIACNTSTTADDRYLGVYTVKEPDQPLELDRIAFAFAHPSFHRRINFRMYELYMPQGRWSDGYGRSESPRKQDFPDAIILPMPVVNEYWLTPEMSLALVCEQFRAAGIDIEEPKTA